MEDPAVIDFRIFGGAIALPRGQRAQYLSAACGDNAALRERLEALLPAHEQSEGVLVESAVLAAKATMKLELTEAPDEAIGQKSAATRSWSGWAKAVAEWSMWPSRPSRWGDVALKIIELGRDTKAVVARFEAEPQALAMMDHPNIAKFSMRSRPPLCKKL